MNCMLWNNEDYPWVAQDKKTLRHINKLIEGITRNGNKGKGKPEPLCGDLSGWWLRRIDDKNHLVYRIVADEAVEISQCRGRIGEK